VILARALFEVDWRAARRRKDGMVEPESLALVLPREMRGEMSEMRSTMATKADLSEATADLRSEIGSLRADVASDLMTMEKRLGDRITSLNRAVIEYHSMAVGHGVLYSEIEKHLNLTPDAH
jgi:hypothetical protein